MLPMLLHLYLEKNLSFLSTSTFLNNVQNHRVTSGLYNLQLYNNVPTISYNQHASPILCLSTFYQTTQVTQIESVCYFFIGGGPTIGGGGPFIGGLICPIGPIGPIIGPIGPIGPIIGGLIPIIGGGIGPCGPIIIGPPGPIGPAGCIPGGIIPGGP